MATRVSKQPKTSALCKNNLSNYEERLLAFLSRMLYCGMTTLTALSSLSLSPQIYIPCIYLDAVIYCF